MEARFAMDAQRWTATFSRSASCGPSCEQDVCTAVDGPWLCAKAFLPIKKDVPQFLRFLELAQDGVRPQGEPVARKSGEDFASRLGDEILHLLPREQATGMGTWHARERPLIAVIEKRTKCVQADDLDGRKKALDEVTPGSGERHHACKHWSLTARDSETFA